MAVKVGNEFKERNGSNKYRVYALTGTSKGVPSTDVLAYLVRTSKVSFLNYSDKFVTLPVETISEFFVPLENS
jgi:hypothetical protein